MDSKATLLCKSYLTHFQTFLPVYFYGTPTGKIYCIYSRFYQRSHSVTNLEIVFLQHKNFIYNYDLELIFGDENNVITPENFRRQVNQPRQPYIMMKLYGKFKSYAEVNKFLNEKLVDKIQHLELEHA